MSQPSGGQQVAPGAAAFAKVAESAQQAAEAIVRADDAYAEYVRLAVQAEEAAALARKCAAGVLQAAPVSVQPRRGSGPTLRRRQQRARATAARVCGGLSSDSTMGSKTMSGAELSPSGAVSSSSDEQRSSEGRAGTLADLAKKEQILADPAELNEANQSSLKAGCVSEVEAGSLRMGAEAPRLAECRVHQRVHGAGDARCEGEAAPPQVPSKIPASLPERRYAIDANGDEIICSDTVRPKGSLTEIKACCDAMGCAWDPVHMGQHGTVSYIAGQSRDEAVVLCLFAGSADPAFVPAACLEFLFDAEAWRPQEPEEGTDEDLLDYAPASGGLSLSRRSVQASLDC